MNVGADLDGNVAACGACCGRRGARPMSSGSAVRDAQLPLALLAGVTLELLLPVL